MKHLFLKTMREQVQQDLENPLELIKKPAPKTGWIKLIRQALGMTGSQLAQRLGHAQSNITALEMREQEGTVTLNSLDKTAQAMNCRLVYFFVPKTSLNQILSDQAHIVAKKHIKNIGHSMTLEQQSLTPQQLQSQEEALVNELLQGNLKHLWKE